MDPVAHYQQVKEKRQRLALEAERSAGAAEQAGKDLFRVSGAKTLAEAEVVLTKLKKQLATAIADRDRLLAEVQAEIDQPREEL